MATPLGHSLAGFVVYKFFYPEDKKINWLRAISLILIANLPDLDFLPGFLAGSLNRNHHGIIHSLGFSLLAAAALGFVFQKWLKRNFLKSWGIIFLTLVFHLLIDFFTLDLSRPAGGKFLWPLSNNFFISKLPILPPFWRDRWPDIFQPQNIATLLVEGALFGLIIIVIENIRKNPQNPTAR